MQIYQTRKGIRRLDEYSDRSAAVGDNVWYDPFSKDLVTESTDISRESVVHAYDQDLSSGFVFLPMKVWNFALIIWLGLILFLSFRIALWMMLRLPIGKLMCP